MNRPPFSPHKEKQKQFSGNTSTLRAFVIALICAVLSLMFTQSSVWFYKNNQVYVEKQAVGYHTAKEVHFLFKDDDMLIDDVSKIKSNRGDVTKYFLPDESVMIHGKKELGYDVAVQPSCLTAKAEWQLSMGIKTQPDTSEQGEVIQLHALQIPLLSVSCAQTLFPEDKPIQTSTVEYPLWVSEAGILPIPMKQIKEKKTSGPIVYSVSCWKFANKRFPRIHLLYDGGNSRSAQEAMKKLEGYLLGLNEKKQEKFYTKDCVVVSLYWDAAPQKDVCEQWEPVPTSFAIFSATAAKGDAQP